MFAKNVVHTGYLVSDIEQSLRFYEKFGFSVYVRMPMGDAEQNKIGEVVFLSLPGDGPRLELQQLFAEPRPDAGNARGHIGITIVDMDLALQSLASSDLSPEIPPFRPVKGGATICFFRDPDGHLVELLAGLDL
ncbi:VOC family protein [Agrobacterium vitis]|nr:VOC family protein [Agrobacterium vitis]MCM2438743.1 VOC family protein [Agrobacterium vitis]